MSFTTPAFLALFAVLSLANQARADSAADNFNKLKDGLTSSSPKVRIVAVSGISKSKDAHARELIEPLLKDSEPTVRVTVVEGLGLDFLADVQFGIDKVRARPFLGHAIDKGLRRLLLHRFPFSIIYSVEVDAILIVALAHYGRRPGYWKERVVS